MAEDWYGTVLQIAALLGIASTAIYLFIALKNYTKEQKKDANQRQLESDAKIKQSTDGAVNQITSKIENELEDIKRDRKFKLEQFDELRIQFSKISEKLEELDKKCIIYDYKIPELQAIKKDLEIIKNAIIKYK